MPSQDVSKYTNDNESQLAIKRKWQIALRRYLIDGNPAVAYASYFGLPAKEFKTWISGQFQNGMNWENFGSRWNFTQRVPTALFDLLNEEHLRLCWHFTNILVQDSEAESVDSPKALLSAKKFFQSLGEVKKLPVLELMISHLEKFESSNDATTNKAPQFIQANLDLLLKLQTFDNDDFARLNKGEKLQEILSEKEILKKYGS